MKITYMFLTVLFFLSILFSESYSQCTPRPLPFMEDFFGNPLGSCTPQDGGWTTTSAASGAGWWVPSPITNYAGGQAPEIEAYGDQANGGVIETIVLTSPPINTTSLSALTLSFKHNLFTTNSAASGSDYISLRAETSSDLLSWTSVYNDGYNATGSLSSVVNETRTVAISNITSDSIYIRFSISGVLFKLWGWEIDDITLIDNTTSIRDINESNVSVYYDRHLKTISVRALKSSHGGVVLSDITGKRIYQSQIHDGNLAIPASAFPAGVYVLQFQNEKKVITKKITIE